MTVSAQDAAVVFDRHGIELLAADAAQYAAEANETLDPMGSLAEFARQLREEWEEQWCFWPEAGVLMRKSTRDFP